MTHKRFSNAKAEAMQHRRRFPPLNALRAFEAAARHLSFTRAADELAVTQAAVSHQIKTLEEHLGINLFRRFNRSLALTEAGRAYLPALREAFDLIDQATRDLRERDSSGPLRVSVLPSFAAKWLLPRLSRFRQRHPDIDVLISADHGMVDFARDNADMAIRFGRGSYPGLRMDFIMDDYAVPVCSPRLLEGEEPLREPQDLKHQTLLQDECHGPDDQPDWRYWLTAAGVTDIEADKGPGFSDSAMVLQAAIAGEGVALTRWSLAAEDVAAGRLAQPFQLYQKTNFSYYAISPIPTDEWRKVRLFREWLLEETAPLREENFRPPGTMLT
jgi:LysR family glycine cleavage system transcriptional activator